ncbi:hypothetical protein PMAYCL1PPCAC_23239, partial [Pristionchus mayeri]
SLNNEEDADLSMDSLKVSLLCPMGKTRMKIAARFRNCTHITCFDLDSYLQMNEGRLVWSCCICHQKAFSVDSLIIDKYLTHLAETLHRSAIEVEFAREGGYRAIKADGTEVPSSDDGEGEETKERTIMKLTEGIELIKDSDFIVLGNDDPNEHETAEVIAPPMPLSRPEIVFIKTVSATPGGSTLADSDTSSSLSSGSDYTRPPSTSTTSSMRSTVVVDRIMGAEASSSTGGRYNTNRFNNHQLRTLQQFFDNQVYPKDDDIEMLSKELQVPQRVVLVWFQNAREKITARAHLINQNRPNVEGVDRSLTGKEQTASHPSTSSTTSHSPRGSAAGETVPAGTHEIEMVGQITATPRTVPQERMRAWSGMSLHPGAMSIRPTAARVSFSVSTPSHKESESATPSRKESDSAASSQVESAASTPLGGAVQNTPVLRRSKRLSEKMTPSQPPTKKAKISRLE